MSDDFNIIEPDGLESDLQELVKEQFDLFKHLTDQEIMQNLTGITNIVRLLRILMEAVHGEEFRAAFHDAILQVYEDAINSDPSNTILEVILARGEYNSLRERLEAIVNEITEIILKHDANVEQLDGRIDRILEEIEDIYKILNSLTGAGVYRTMTPGVDYDTTFFNKWYTPSGNVRVRYIETNSYYEIIMDAPTSSDNIYRLYHDGLIAANVRMRHSSSVEDEPTSRIFGVNFKGDFADLQNMTMRSQGGGGIWNLRPAAIRAAWDANCNIVENNSGCKALVCWGSYADGYNQQLNISAYTSLAAWTGEIACSGGANCTMTMLLIK